MCDFMYVGVVGCIRACVDSLIVESEVSQVIYFPPAKAQWVFGVALDATEHTDVGKQLRDGLLVSMGTAEGFPVDAFIGCTTPVEATRICNGSIPIPNVGGVALKHQISEGAFEPFTQTAYHAIEFADGTERMYWGTGEGGCGGVNTTLLAIMRGGTPGVWTRGNVVVGKAERFTIEQLFMFPVFIARLHGSYGNANYVFGLVLSWFVLIATGATAAALALTPGAAMRARRSLVCDVRSLGVASALLALLLYAAVCMDLLLQLRSTLQRIQWDGATGSMALFFGLVLLSANLLPATLAAYVARLHSTTMSGDRPSIAMAVPLALGGLLAFYSVALISLGETPQVPLVIGGISGVTVVLALLTAIRGSSVGAFAVLLIGTCTVLMFYLGSGYWLAPVALVVAAFALAFRVA